MNKIITTLPTKSVPMDVERPLLIEVTPLELAANTDQCLANLVRARAAEILNVPRV
jgi:hypothetical protein